MITLIITYLTKIRAKLRWLSILTSLLPSFISSCTRKSWATRKGGGCLGCSLITQCHNLILGVLLNEIIPMVNSILKISVAVYHDKRWLNHICFSIHQSQGNTNTPAMTANTNSKFCLQQKPPLICFRLRFTLHGYLL